jgi:uncharacterized repeat protein (TIGR01451 family)
MTQSRLTKNLKILILAVFVVLVLFLALSKLIILRGIAESSQDPAAPARSSQNSSLVGITIEEFIAGFTNPTVIVHAGDASGRLFVSEKQGKIFIIQNGVRLATPFLDISQKVNAEVERGLLGLAFHPNFENNGFFYTFYTRNPDGAIVIARFKVSGNPDIADPGSEFPVMVIDHNLPIHNAGQITFGPDNKLYIGIGDNDEQGDPNNHAQDLSKLYGKILRIEVSGEPYTIPGDNPFVNQAGKRPEIWVYGLRNPWRFSFDRHTGDLWIGDVGQNNWEEVNFRWNGTAAGENFGWRCKEGNHLAYTEFAPCNDPSQVAEMVNPLAEYPHSVGASITGGYVYRGDQYPGLQGVYFFADYVYGKVFSLTRLNGGGWSEPQVELETNLKISTFGEDEAGEIYLADYQGGKIYRLKQASQQAPDLTQSKITTDTNYANPGATVAYTIKLQNTGMPTAETLFLTDSVPVGLDYLPGTIAATSGSVDDTSGSILTWQGQLSASNPITITYQVQVASEAQFSQITKVDLSGRGYENHSLSHALQLPGHYLSTTIEDFFLPGSQPNSLQEALVLPDSCDVCHTEPIYDKWRASLMSQAGRDPLFWAAVEVANRDAANSGEFCLRCHTPNGWLNGRSHPADGSALTSYDIDSGVNCAICHRAVEGVLVSSDEATNRDPTIRSAISPSLPADHIGSAMFVIDPMDYRRGPFSLGVNFSYHPNETYATNYLGFTPNDYVSRSRLCGTCHNIDNPALSWDNERNQFWPNATQTSAPSFDQGQLYPIETTYDEWLNSSYATVGVYAPQFAGSAINGIVGACQDCHMQRSAGIAAEKSFNPVQRDCSTTGCLPIHEFVGGNSWIPEILQDERWRLNNKNIANSLNQTSFQAESMLSRAATLEVSLEQVGDGKEALIRIYNQTGHKLPTGYAEGRRMWINLKAFDDQLNFLYESGAYNQETGVLSLDPDVRIYEALQGISTELANATGVPSGKSFHFVLNNMVEKDNRIPPRGFTQEAYGRPGLQPVGTTYSDGQYWDDTRYKLPASTSFIIVTLYYQTTTGEYIEFLKSNGGLDSQTLAELWKTNPAPPVTMATVLTPGNRIYLPVMTKNR